MVNCNQCDFDTIWEDQLKHILNGNLKEEKKSDFNLLFKQRRPSPSQNRVKQKQPDYSVKCVTIKLGRQSQETHEKT